MRVGRGQPRRLAGRQSRVKRIGNLFDRVISLENLDVAERNARKGKRKRRCIAEFDKDRDGNLRRLQQMLADGTFRTSPYTVFTVKEPKEREIYRLPYFPDRIVHHAIMNVCEPIWTRTFTHNTYSCITGRGISGASREVERIIRSFDGRPLYCLKTDVRKYYPSIDNGIMKSIVRRKIKDAWLLALLDEIIDSARGLPIGNYLSQYLSNLYLAYFMHEVNEVWKVKATEYADDICFFSDSKPALHEALDKVRAYFSGRLNLEIKGNWQIFPVAEDVGDRHGRALDYLGFKFYRRRKLLRKRIKQNLFRTVASMKKSGRTITDKEFKQRMASWMGWCMHSNSKNLLKKIDMEFSEMVRNGTVKLSGNYYDCDKVPLDSLINKRIEVLGYVSDIKTEHGEGRIVVHCKDGGKEVKFFTNCKRLKEVLLQLPPDNPHPPASDGGAEPTGAAKDAGCAAQGNFTPFFTTIVSVQDGNRRYYKFT